MVFISRGPWPNKTLCLLAVVLGTAALLYFLANPSDTILWASTYTDGRSGSTVESPKMPTRYAYVIFLSDDMVPDGQESIHQDLYFVATRILLYQLLHAPDIATAYDVVVTVTPTVLEEKRARMRKDGATVIVLDPIDVGWIKAGEHRWDSVMQKFRIWQMTQYEKILILDSDIVLQANIDGVFEDGKGVARTPLDLPNVQQLEHEAPYPSEYLLAATAELKEHVHKYPPEGPEDYYNGGGYLNAGFMLLKPSIELFDYYMSMTKINPRQENGEWRFNPAWPEQALLNYVHRQDGPMPWTQLDPLWMLHLGLLGDLKQMPKGIHDKWWAQPDMSVYLESWKWRMDAFWQGREGGS